MLFCHLVAIFLRQSSLSSLFLFSMLGEIMSGIWNETGCHTRIASRKNLLTRSYTCIGYCTYKANPQATKKPATDSKKF